MEKTDKLSAMEIQEIKEEARWLMETIIKADENATEFRQLAGNVSAYSEALEHFEGNNCLWLLTASEDELTQCAALSFDEARDEIAFNGTLF